MVGAVALLLVPMSAFLVFYCGSNNRYEGEAMCGVPLLAVLGIWAVETRFQAAPRVRSLARNLWVALAGYSVLFAFCAAIQRDEIFRTVHPRAYRALAHAFDLPSYLRDRMSGTRYGPVSLEVRFPSGRPGTNEPLVVTGWAPYSNVLFVDYVDSTHVRFGFVGVGGVARSAPVEVDYARAHSLTVSMGSLYPPPEHPFFDTLDARDAEALADTLFVAMDGTTVMNERTHFFDGADRKPVLGRGPPVPGLNWKFTGQISGG
jgi:hypothetical protein